VSTKEREKSSGKPRRRSGKPKQRGQKADQQQRPTPDQPDEGQLGAMAASTDALTDGVAAPSELPSSGAATPLISEVAPMDAPSIGDVARMDAPSIVDVASTDPVTNDATPPSELPSSDASIPLSGDVIPPDVPSIGDVAPAESRRVSIRTIANAYGSYTEKSFQETSSFVEKLMGVRSFDKVIEVQTEFARQAHATFVAESQKICGLYAELARQIFRSWQGASWSR
jgi:Phasin protein